ncbi:hypothetical protein C8R44DRAFT_744351 [Mycena epipterygia]|nr:hypothetical protein C8R44DRAFT_744351 [Mycena epipterygia]
MEAVLPGTREGPVLPWGQAVGHRPGCPPWRRGERVKKSDQIMTIPCLLAIKHASAVMMTTNHPQGKTLGGGSIILTASSKETTHFRDTPHEANLFQPAAGIRSGAGPIDLLVKLRKGICSDKSGSLTPLSGARNAENIDVPTRYVAVCPGLTEAGMTEPAFEYARERGTIGKVDNLTHWGGVNRTPYGRRELRGETLGRDGQIEFRKAMYFYHTLSEHDPPFEAPSNMFPGIVVTLLVSLAIGCKVESFGIYDGMVTIA